MNRTEDELAQISSWFSEQGLGPGATADEQLCVLWRALQHSQRNLTSLNKSLDLQRSQYAAEIVEVRKSLEQIRVFTGHKNILAQEIQDENDQLRDQLQRLLSQQDAQVSEVAKMLYDQGLTELVHSSPSEQVAYLLVERASLLDTSQGHGAHSDQPGTGVQGRAVGTGQTAHKRALRHSQSPWKKLLGLNKNHGKYLLIPAESRHLSEQASSVQKECHRLERDLEEGSKRLAMAHNEIRRLTNELESAHMMERAYEPELEAAKHEVEQLRREVEQVKKYEMVSLRKAKELNDSLNGEIQCLRNRLGAETSSRLQGPVVKQLQTVQIQTDSSSEPEEVLVLQTEVGKLQSALQEMQSRAEDAAELNKSLEAEVTQTNEVRVHLQNKIEMQMKCLSAQESQIEALKLELESFQKEKNHNKEIAPDICLKESQLSYPSESHQRLVQENNDSFCTKDDCKFLKKELCESLKSLNQEKRKYHEMKARLKLRLVQAKQKLEHETKWRDERIEDLERELFLCSYSLTKEKELMTTVTMENDKLLVERKRLLQQQLNEELYNKKNRNTVFQYRIEDLEMENGKLQKKILDLSTQVLSMERSLQSLRAAEVLKDCDSRKILAQLPAQTVCPQLLDISSQTCSSRDGAETWSQCSSLARSGEMGYLNLNFSQSLSLHNATDP